MEVLLCSAFRLLVSLLVICSVVSKLTKLTVMSAGKLQSFIKGPTAVYDGNDSIYLIGSYERSNVSQILKYDISTTKVSILGEVINHYERGTLEMDGLGNLFYFDSFKIAKFNLTSGIMNRVGDLSPGFMKNIFSSKYNEHITVLINQCARILSFDFDTLQIRNIWEREKDTIFGYTMFMFECPDIFSTHTVCVWKNRMTIVTKIGETFSLDLFTFEASSIPQTLYQNFSNFRGVCNEEYIYSIGIYSGSLSSENETIFAMSVFNMETEKLRYVYLENLPYDQTVSVFDPPIGAFVKKLNRIYFFGGKSHSNNSQFKWESNYSDIWYVQLETNETIGISLLEGNTKPCKYDQFGFMSLEWIYGLSIFGGGLILAAVIVIFALQTKYCKIGINLKTNRIWKKKSPIETTAGCESVNIWRSEQFCRLTPSPEIGKGTFAVVYKAEDLLYPELFYAIKQIALYKALVHLRTWEVKKVFREVNNLMEIENENVVKLYDFWVEDNCGKALCKEGLMEYLDFHEWSATQDYYLYMKMELCDSTLQDWLKTHPLFNDRKETEVKSMFFPIVEGLRGIHRKGIIHRDIKPNNIFHCEKRDLWKIGDLGLSIKVQDATSALTVIGCESYKSPEMDSGEYDSKTDVFSLGLTFLEIIHVFPNEFARIAIFDAIRNGERNDGICATLLPEILELIFKMLKKDPNLRIDITDKLFDNLLLKPLET